MLSPIPFPVYLTCSLCSFHSLHNVCVSPLFPSQNSHSFIHLCVGRNLFPFQSPLLVNRLPGKNDTCAAPSSSLFAVLSARMQLARLQNIMHFYVVGGSAASTIGTNDHENPWCCAARPTLDRELRFSCSSPLKPLLPSVINSF